MCMFCRSLFVLFLLAIVLSPVSLWYLQTLLTLVFGNLFLHLYISASLQIRPKYIFTLVCLYLHKCHSLWSSFAFLRSQMGGLAHCKTWFNRPFLRYTSLLPLPSQDRYSYFNFSVVVSWFCLYCGLSYFDYLLSTFTLVFSNLFFYLYVFLLHYKYGRGIFLPLCVCTNKNVIQFG